MIKKSSVEKLVRRVLAAELEEAPVFKTGDILYSSWGYDQTNINFYEVIKATGSSTVVRELESRVVGYPGDDKLLVPVPGKFAGPPLRRKSPSPTDPYRNLRITNYELARIWDGKPKRADHMGGH